MKLEIRQVPDYLKPKLFRFPWLEKLKNNKKKFFVFVREHKRKDLNSVLRPDVQSKGIVSGSSLKLKKIGNSNYFDTSSNLLIMPTYSQSWHCIQFWGLCFNLWRRKWDLYLNFYGYILRLFKKFELSKKKITIKILPFHIRHIPRSSFRTF